MRLHRALAPDANVGAQRHIDALLAELPLAFDQREIALLDPPFAQQRVQRAQRRGLARHQQQAAGVAIQPVHQFEIFLRTRGAQGLDDTEAHATAAVHGDTRRLVDHQQLRILVHDGVAHARNQRFRRAPWRCSGTGFHRRHAHDVVCLQPCVRLGALAVHAHLALANHSKNMGLRHVGEDSARESCRGAVPPRARPPRLGALWPQRIRRPADYAARAPQGIRNVLFSLRVSRYDAARASPVTVSDARCRGAIERNHKTNRTRRMLVGPRQRGHRSKAHSKRSAWQAIQKIPPARRR